MTNGYGFLFCKLFFTDVLFLQVMPVWSRKEYTPLVIDVALANRFPVEGLIRLF